jgi:hypothetical protein
MPHIFSVLIYAKQGEVRERLKRSLAIAHLTIAVLINVIIYSAVTTLFQATAPPVKSREDK